MKIADIDPRSKRIIAAGPIRSGKTLQFLTLPGPKFGFLFDPNAADTLRAYGKDIDMDVELFLPDGLNINMQTLTKGKRDTDVLTKEPLAYKRFAEFFDRFVDDEAFEYHHSKYNNILFDGATAFQEIALDRVLFLNDRPGKWPERDDWTSFANTTRAVLRRLTALERKIIYMPVHTELKDTKLEGVIYQLRLLGDLKGTIPPNFTDIWYFYNDLDNNNKPVYKIQTRSDELKRTLGCSMDNIKVIEDVTLNLNRELEGQGIAKLLTEAGVFESS